MLIGELARRSGLSKDGLRHYESLGLIHSSPVRAGSRIYRDYDETTLIRLSLIALGRRLYIPLKEIAEVLDELVSETLTREEIKDGLAVHLARIDARIADLQNAREELVEIMANPDKSFVNPLMRRRGLMLDDRATP